MAKQLNVVTGATGLLGSHITKALVERGERVRALVRPTSDVAALRALGVELVQGDLLDTSTLATLVNGADRVYHCAGKVSDWAPWRVHRAQSVEATTALLKTCQTAGVGRVLYVSSIHVYGKQRADAGPVTEATPLARRGFAVRLAYPRAKIETEKALRQFGALATVIRASWIYGPGDRMLPRLAKALRAGWSSYVNSADRPLNIIAAEDVAEGAILAANHPAAGGQAYNLCSEGGFTQREFFELVTSTLGLPPVHRCSPFWLAYFGGWLSEAVGRLIRIQRPPHLTRLGVIRLSRPVTYSTAKARTQLGWQPRVDPRQGLRRALDWYMQHEDAAQKMDEPHSAQLVATS